MNYLNNFEINYQEKINIYNSFKRRKSLIPIRPVMQGRK